VKPIVKVKEVTPTEKNAQKEYGAQSCRGSVLPRQVGVPHAELVFAEMLSREKEFVEEWAALYHSYNSPALVYEVQAAIAHILLDFNSDTGSLPRLLMEPFSKIPDASALQKIFPSWPDRDHSIMFKAVGPEQGT